MSAENITVPLTGLALGTFWGALNPWALTGAAFGCFFYLFMSSLLKGWQRAQLLIFSFGVGYAVGEFLYGGGPPFSQKAMFVSAASAALASAVFTAFYHVIDKGGAMPPWLESLLDRFPIFRRKGGE